MLLKRFTTFLCVYIFCGTIFGQCPIIPTPTSYKERKKEVKLDASYTIFAKYPLPENIKNYVKDGLKNYFGMNQDTEHFFLPTHISFSKIQSDEKKDFYHIWMENSIIIIEYTSDASAFYAINSLFQLIYQKNGENYIKNCDISDSPQFEWRGLHLDVSRHFFTVEEVKRYIDLMAFYKFNTFHWHLTDDQGWRIEIKKFPKLTEIGAWRDSTVNKHYTTSPRTYTVERYGGFYTQEQIKEVVKYAADRYINIVPEIEMPGHARAALSAYPELSCTGKQQGAEALWGVFDDIYCSKQESIDFNKAVLEEVLELFPSKYIHVGGDEAPKVRWKECPNCQQVMRENGIKDEHGLQSYFIRQMDDYLTSKGRKLIGWDEILEGGLSPNAAVMSWRGFEGGIEAVKQGHAVVMSPGSHCYFDHYQSRNPNEPIGFGGFTPLEKVYEFNPVPSGLTTEQKKLVLGGQANLWTEYIPDMKQLEYMVYPRALALIEVLWNGDKKPTFDDFQYKLIKYHIPLLEKRKVNFSKALFYPTLKTYISKNKFVYEFVSPDLYDLRTSGLIDSFQEFTKDVKLSFSLNGGFPDKNLEVQINPIINEKRESAINFSFQVHDGLGQKIKFVTEPNKKYAYNKELALVDGIIGRIPWNSSEWIAFDTTEIVLEMNLQQEKMIKSIDLSFLDDVSSWIHVPETVEIYLSTDGKKWEKALSSKLNSKSNLPVNLQGKYIRFAIHSKTKIPDGLPGAGHTPWTFMDEIILDLE